jgi:predicted transcriptional regulator of viral defense system
MKIAELARINKLYFGHEEISRVLGINAASAKVTAGRYLRQGWLLRLKKNVYIRREVWNGLEREDKFVLANLGQVPSYLSLSTALDYYEITTQGIRNVFESVALKRTKEIFLDGSVFRYTKIKGTVYSGFKKERGFFIATPEKALLDAFYLMSFGRYALDLSALDATKIDREKIRFLSQSFPQKTRTLLKTHGYLATA